MPTGYDLLEHSHEFRIHLLKRLSAGLLDSLIIFFPIILIIYYFNLEPKELLAGVLSGFGWFLYSTIIESKTGTSLGKNMMGMIVVSVDGPMTYSKGIIRNVPKMFWFIFLPVDILVGLTKDADPRQRWVDSVSGTSVVKSNKGVW